MTTMITMLSLDEEVQQIWKRIAEAYDHGKGIRLSFDEIRILYLGDNAVETTISNILYPEDD